MRPYGWLDVKVGADSYITYVQSQVATTEGYDSLLELHLDGITIVTSVNMQTFMTADVCRVCIQHVIRVNSAVVAVDAYTSQMERSTYLGL